MNKARVESFSDGVFAIAITLLILGIPIPNLTRIEDEQLRSGLINALHELIPYITSFATIGIIWLNHHAMFHAVERVDHPTLVINLLLLLVVSFIPFPTAVLGRYGALPSSAFLYGCVLTMLGIAYSMLSSHILKSGLSRKEVRERSHWPRLRNVLGTATYATATMLSLRFPRAGVTIYFLLAVFYFLPIRGLPITQESTM
jgi:TMEM175 potassium channel family protein